MGTHRFGLPLADGDTGLLCVLEGYSFQRVQWRGLLAVCVGTKCVAWGAQCSAVSTAGPWGRASRRRMRRAGVGA
jgi:hypothetical protein